MTEQARMQNWRGCAFADCSPAVDSNAAAARMVLLITQKYFKSLSQRPCTQKPHLLVCLLRCLAAAVKAAAAAGSLRACTLKIH